MDKEILIERLNADSTEERLLAVRQLKKLLDAGHIATPVREGYTNNHVHTKYSFSPYSPAKAVWVAFMSGLDTAGIIDHDAVGGAEEFIEAGKILGIATTTGFEIRTDWSATRLNGRMINNPDQASIAYVCAHGLPHTRIKEADSFLSPIREARGKRNRAMTKRLNDIMYPYGIMVNYDEDVLPLSYAAHGGEVTERHILFALAKKLMNRFEKSEQLADFINDIMHISLTENHRAFLKDKKGDTYEYDLLNMLKGSFVSSIYIDTGLKEAPPVSDAVTIIKGLGAIPTYCYLGDVVDSPTGDKREQKFEDEYLEDLFLECKEIGFQAIAFMPSRNTKQQLQRVMELCDRYGFMQISGEDINQPRQSFICKQLKDEMFAHLTDAAWALAGHEEAATKNLQDSIFTDGERLNTQELKKRIEEYKRIGMQNKVDGGLS